MKLLKCLGVTALIIAMFLALGVVGRMESEDRQYQCGEITQDEMTSGEDLFRLFIGCGILAAAGGVTWMIGAYIEADRVERRYRRLYK